MDRSDEFNPRPWNDESVSNERSQRAGDILGIGKAVPKEPGDPSAAHDPESAAKRRERIRSGDEEQAYARTPERSSGETSIDMGAGGSGTQIDEE